MNALIIYDRVDLAIRLNSMLSREAISQRQRFDIKFWRLDLLMHPAKAAIAMEEAMRAHVLILAARIQPRVAPELLDWLEEWAATRHVPDAAIAIFDGRNDDHLSVQATPGLERLARQYGLTFIFGDVNPDDTQLFGAEQGRDLVLAGTDRVS